MQVVFSFFQPRCPALVRQVFQIHVDGPQFRFILALNLVQVKQDPAFCILGPAVNVDEGLEPVFLAAVKKPINRPFLIGLAVVLVEVLEEIVAEFFLRRRAACPQGIREECQVSLEVFPAKGLL